MRTRTIFLMAVICLFPGFMTISAQAQSAVDEFPKDLLAAAAKLVVTSVSGPATATQGKNISITYTVKNQGTAPSAAYKVGLFLSSDNKTDAAADRLLDKVTFSTGLAPGESKTTTTSVLVPRNGLSGAYRYGAIVGSSKKASAKKVFLDRYSLSNNDETVTDHKTGLVWQRTDDGQKRDWDTAVQYCLDLSLAGLTDWRLPSMDELLTIVDYALYFPAINSVFDSYDDSYWSSTVHAFYQVDGRWPVRFTDGYAAAMSKSVAFSVRCVRGGP